MKESIAYATKRSCQTSIGALRRVEIKSVEVSSSN